MIYSIHISHQSAVEPRAKRFSFDHVSSRPTRKVKKLVVSQVTQNKSLRAKRTHSISNCLTRTDRCFNNLLCSYIMMSSNAVQAASEFPASKNVPTTEVCFSSIRTLCVPSVEFTSFEEKAAAVQAQGNSIGFFLAAVFFTFFFQNMTRIGTDSIFGNSVKAKPYSSKVTSAKTFNFPKRIFSKRKWGGNGESELNFLARPIDFKMTYNREGELNVNTVKFNKKRWGGNTPNWSSPELDLSKVTNTRAINVSPPQFKRKIWGGDGLMYKGKAKYNSPGMDFKKTSIKTFSFKRPRFIRKAYGGDNIFPHLTDIKYDKSAVQGLSSEREFLLKKSSGYVTTKPSKISRTNEPEETETQLELNGDPHTDSAKNDTGKTTALESRSEEIGLASDDGSLKD